MSKGLDLLSEIDSFLAAVETEKAAETASTQGHVQNQGDTGTSHPSKSIDDGTQDASEGSRSAENTADVKSSVPGQSVDVAKEDKMEGKSENPLTTAKPTGEDPSNETSSANGLIGGEAGKDSSGQDTKHPAKVDFGGKYAAASPATIKDAAARLLERINDYNAQVAALNISTNNSSEKKAKDSSNSGNASTSEPKKEDSNNDKASNSKEASAVDSDEEAGKKAAEIAANELALTGPGAELIEHIAKEAMADANRVADFCDGLHQGANESEQENNVKTARKDATEMHAVIKKAIEDNMAGADAMAYGGEGEGPETAGEGAGSGGEIEQIVAELQAAGIDPEILAQLNPADLAAAIVEASSGSSEGASEINEEPPPAVEATPEMAPTAAI